MKIKRFSRESQPEKSGVSGAGKESVNLRTHGGETHIMLYFGLHIAKDTRPFYYLVIPDDERVPRPKAISLT
jgi:hypothetical protein